MYDHQVKYIIHRMHCQENLKFDVIPRNEGETTTRAPEIGFISSTTVKVICPEYPQSNMEVVFIDGYS